MILILSLSWKRKVLTTDQKLEQIKTRLLPLDPRVAEFNFYTHPNKSYIAGNRDIFMCIHNEEEGYYPDNFLLYIAIHEITHGLIPVNTENHPPIFNQTFDQLKDKAIRLGIYDPSIPFPKQYCGKPINEYYT